MNIHEMQIRSDRRLILVQYI